MKKKCVSGALKKFARKRRSCNFSPWLRIKKDVAKYKFLYLLIIFGRNILPLTFITSKVFKTLISQTEIISDFHWNMFSNFVLDLKETFWEAYEKKKSEMASLNCEFVKKYQLRLMNWSLKGVFFLLNANASYAILKTIFFKVEFLHEPNFCLNQIITLNKLSHAINFYMNQTFAQIYLHL